MSGPDVAEDEHLVHEEDVLAQQEEYSITPEPAVDPKSTTPEADLPPQAGGLATKASEAMVNATRQMQEVVDEGIEDGINSMERLTGVDIDGDGDIGLKGRPNNMVISGAASLGADDELHDVETSGVDVVGPLGDEFDLTQPAKSSPSAEEVPTSARRTLAKHDAPLVPGFSSFQLTPSPRWTHAKPSRRALSSARSSLGSARSSATPRSSRSVTSLGPSTTSFAGSSTMATTDHAR